MILILKYIFLGILFYILIIPITEQIAVLICQWFEYLKSLLLYKLTEIQVKIDEIAESKPTGSTRTVGFIIPEEEEDDE